MKRRRFWFRATWGACFVALFFPSVIPVPNAYAKLFAAAGLLLFIFGIIQAVRNELYKGERLKAIARGECPKCGCELADPPSTTCPSCGDQLEEANDAGGKG